MVKLSDILLFRMTHIENIPHILQNGITHKSSEKSNSNYLAIGDDSIITRRTLFKLANGKLLSDYIPFYFWGRMPMLYVIQNGYNTVKKANPKDIVYIITSVQQIVDAKLSFCFTDGHAIDSFTQQYYENNLDRIDSVLDFDAIKKQYWRDDNDLDLKRRKEAEFLVYGDINISHILGYFVFNDNAKHKLINFGVVENQIYIKPHFYF